MKYNRINIMLPTRGRVKNDRLPRLMRSIRDMTKNKNAVSITLMVDIDDIETIAYVESGCDGVGVPVHVITNDTPTGPHLALFYNRIYKETPDNAPSTLVSMIGDDMEFETLGWEQMVLDTANDNDGRCIVHGDDGIQHERMPVHLFTSRSLVEKTGVPFMWEKWRANMIDYVWGEVGRKLGITRYLPGMKITHHHSSIEGGDETYHGMDAYRVFASGREALINAYVDMIVKTVRAR